MKTKQELFDELIGAEKTSKRKAAEQTLKDYPGRTPMGEILFRFHTHAGLCDSDEIVYREPDIMRLLEFLGYPVKFGDEKL